MPHLFPSTNLILYDQAMKRGNTSEVAAYATRTGKWASELGYKKVLINPEVRESSEAIINDEHPPILVLTGYFAKKDAVIKRLQK